MENNDVRFRKIEERMDRTDRLVDALHEEMTALAGKMSALVDAQIRTEERLARLETAFVTFAEFAKSMSERMDRSDRWKDGIDGDMATLTVKMSALVDAQIRTEAHVARLENAFVTFAELAKSMDERMDSSDRRAEALHLEMTSLTGEMTSLTAKMAALVDAQILTEAKFVESRETQTRIDDRLKALTHIVDRHVSGNGHEHSS